MRRKDISIDDATDFVARQQLFGCYGGGNHLSIDVLTSVRDKRVWFEFSDRRTVVYSGPDLQEAIDLYNAAQR